VAQHQVLEGIVHGLGYRPDIRVVREHQRLPSPTQARELARETGVSVAGSDGYLHDGRTAEEEERASADANIIYGVIEAVETLATNHVTAAEYLRMLPEARSAALKRDVPIAMEWLRALKGAMDEQA